MIKFGVKSAGYTAYDQNDVTTTFDELHTYINDSEKFNADTDNNTSTGAVHLGDYIDLPCLVVETASGYGQFYATNNIDLGTHGKQLRLIVVGINSFNRRDAQPSDTPHVVFQFQNIPEKNRMHVSLTNAMGYLGSDMREYLEDNYLTGLKNAGVPDSYIWNPERFVGKGSGSGVDEISDKLWLPTEREMFGIGPWTSGPWAHRDKETPENQAHLEYYINDTKRIKYNSDDNLPGAYALASAFTNNDDSKRFCGISDSGASDTYNANNINGVSPAFCIK
jgi:hypothetical protein